MDGDQLPNLNEADIGTNPLDEDTDDDGFLDGVDQFPLDPNEWYDSDGDGCGDNSDDFPTDSSECSDSDNDGFGDNIDAFPTDVSEWLDTDGDGFGNNRDACPIVAGNSLSPEGCPDRDGDGKLDLIPKFGTREQMAADHARSNTTSKSFIDNSICSIVNLHTILVCMIYLFLSPNVVLDLMSSICSSVRKEIYSLAFFSETL